MEILVCGGAGYIGSHMVHYLAASGHRPTVFDNLSTGHREALKDVELVTGDLRDKTALSHLFTSRRFDAVMHFCARSLVGESVSKPYIYYDSNVTGTLNLLDAMHQARVSRLIFSSTAAVFGIPEKTPIDESHPTNPINPYGSSKLMVERILSDAAHAYGLHSVALRYFNAVGANTAEDIGEAHEPETHLIPNILRAARGDGARLKVFGNDYPTRDGTCVRDYVHVSDLATAHLAALEFLDKSPGAHLFNLGSNRGFTVMEVIEAARHVTGLPIEYEMAPRRAGDPAVLVASSDKARDLLGWSPTYRDIGLMIESAWHWHRQPRY
jgi:UDP-glucose 4-epimerase